jgi:hypothetical protein
VAFYTGWVDTITVGTARPLRRLSAYYVLVAAATFALVRLFPPAGRLFVGEKIGALSQAAQVLQDGMPGATTMGDDLMAGAVSAALITLVFVGTIVLMLPVTWVYMSTREEGEAHNQSVVQSLIALPIVVAGIVLVVRDSLALAFSLAGVVAAVRFRASLSDPRDVVYIFMAIAIGFAAGVHVLTVATLLSIIFNVVLVLIWQFDFGRNLLQPTAADHWKEPLANLAGSASNGHGVADRDLMLALTPEKADLLTVQFDRVKHLLGSDNAHPKYDAIVMITTDDVGAAQQHVEAILAEHVRRWKLDQVINSQGKPTALYYVVKVKKSMPRDALLTAIRTDAGGSIADASVQVGEAVAVEDGEKRELRKQLEHRD